MTDAGQEGWIINFVAVQVQDGKHRPITNRIEKLVDVPGSREWPGFRFAVANHRGNDQIRIVERGAARVREHVTELTSFVNRSGRLRRAVTANATGEGKLFEEAQQPFFI